MTYIIIAILAAGAAALHWWWSGRYAHLKKECAREKDSLEAVQRMHYQTAAQTEAEQQALFNSMAEGLLVLDREGRKRTSQQNTRIPNPS